MPANFILDEVDKLIQTSTAESQVCDEHQARHFILTTNNISSLDKGMKERCVLVEMDAASTEQLLPIARKVATDMNVVLNDTELTAEIAVANGSLREVMNRIERLARCKRSQSTI